MSVVSIGSMRTLRGRRARRPNVVIILADDLGYGDLSCYGNTILATPNIDRLAAAGVRCSQHYSGAPICAPARAALLTGRYHHRVGALSVESNRGLDRIALRERTLGDLFTAAGYRTGYVGKWHSGLFDHRYHPNRRGFAEFAGFLNGIMDYWDWYLDYNGAPRRADGRYQTDVFTDEAVQFIRRHTRPPRRAAAASPPPEPFCLVVAYHTPHAPLQAPAQCSAPFKQRGDLNAAVATLYGMVARMDWGVGRILAALDERGCAEDTIVLLTSDNGPYLGRQPFAGRHFSMSRYNGPFRGQKSEVLEGGIRVPGIVRWLAGLPAGADCHAMIHFCDWLPTLAAAAGAAPGGRPLDGCDQLQSLRGVSVAGAPPRFWQFNRYDPVPHCNLAMRDGPWKLYWPRIPEAMVKLRSDNVAVRWLMAAHHFEMAVSNPPVARRLSPPGAAQLYRIPDDPTEAHDLAPSHPEVAARMRRAAENWFAEVEAERRQIVAQYGAAGS